MSEELWQALESLTMGAVWIIAIAIILVIIDGTY